MNEIGRRQWIANACALALGVGVPAVGIAQRGRRTSGRDAGAPDRGAVPGHENWVLLGEKDVDFRLEREVLPIGRHHGAFRHLAFTVEGNDVHLLEMTIVLENGERLVLAYNHTIQTFGSSSVLDLPGEAREIHHLEFTYHSVGRPRRRRTTLRVYGVPD